MPSVSGNPKPAIAAATEEAVLARHVLREFIRDPGEASDEEIAAAIAAEGNISEAIEQLRVASSAAEDDDA